MSDSMAELTDRVIKFRDERNWSQFHSLKDNSLSILIEAAELAEVVRWKERADVDLRRVGEEMADVLYWLLLTAHDCGLDLGSALEAKLNENARKYPVERSKGKALKYDQI